MILEPERVAGSPASRDARLSWPDPSTRSLVRESRSSANHEKFFNESALIGSELNVRYTVETVWKQADWHALMIHRDGVQTECGVPSHPDPGQERLDAQDSDHPLQVVGQHVQGHLGCRGLQALREEVCGSHPALERTEGMLDRALANPHGIGSGSEPLLHRVQHRLMLPAPDPPLSARRALRL